MPDKSIDELLAEIKSYDAPSPSPTPKAKRKAKVVDAFTQSPKGLGLHMSKQLDVLDKPTSGYKPPKKIGAPKLREGGATR